MIKMSEEVKSTLISFYKDYIKFLGSIIYKTYYQESHDTSEIYIWKIFLKQINLKSYLGLVEWSLECTRALNVQFILKT